MCTTSRFNDQCSQLQRGSSGVNCQRVQDGIECAQRLRNGTADFGMFGPETALLLASLKYDGLTVVKELRHHDRINGSFLRNNTKLVHFSSIFNTNFQLQLDMILSLWLW